MNTYALYRFLFLLPPANVVWDEEFFYTCVSFCSQGEGGLCIMSLPVLLPGSMFHTGVPVKRMVSFGGGLHEEGARDRDLQPSPRQRPTLLWQPLKCAVHILLECILV